MGASVRRGPSRKGASTDIRAGGCSGAKYIARQPTQATKSVVIGPVRPAMHDDALEVEAAALALPSEVGGSHRSTVRTSSASSIAVCQLLPWPCGGVQSHQFSNRYHRRYHLSAKRKLFAAIRGNPTGVRFADACKVAGWLGFSAKGQVGSHCAFARTGEPVGLNFQNRNGNISAYQARQLIDMIDKYEDEL